MNRKTLFILITAIPLLLLVVIASLTIRDLYSIRTIDHAQMSRDLRSHLDQRRPASFPLPEGAADSRGTKRTVFVFGSSDILLSDGLTFPAYLEQQHHGLRVVNFGVNGIDSFSVKQRVTEALSAARPDIIILFYGHNDYNTAYNEFILPHYFHKFHALMRLPYLFQDKHKNFSRFNQEPFTYYWFYVLNRPKLLKAFEQLRLVDIHSDDYQPLNQLILDHFIRNNNDILDMAAAARVPVILMTPIANLHAEPVGDLEHTLAYFRKGLASTDYMQQIAYLKKAKDSEIFTFDLRAKSPLIEHIRTISRRGVHVLDLESRLEGMKFGFGNDDFVDYVHLNDRTHKLLADMLFDFMLQNKLVAK